MAGSICVRICLMHTIKYILIGLVFIFICCGIVFTLSHRSNANFTGIVTGDDCINPPQRVIFGGWGCTIIVGNKKISIDHSTNAHPKGLGSLNFNDIATNVKGKKVKVYAHKESDGTYSLEGSPKYYVKLVQ